MDRGESGAGTGQMRCGRSDLQRWEFRERVDGDPRYEGVLDRLDSLYLALTPYEVATQYHSEVVQRNIEIFTVARLMSNLAERYDNGGEAAFTAYKERTGALPGAIL